jgi:hypothetical protein
MSQNDLFIININVLAHDFGVLINPRLRSQHLMRVFIMHHPRVEGQRKREQGGLNLSFYKEPTSAIMALICS